MNNIFIFYGEEKLLIEKEIDKTIKEILGSDDNNSIIKYNLDEDNIEDVIQDALTFSLFSSKKVIICEQSYFLTSNKEEGPTQNIDKLTEYINNQNDASYIIFAVVSSKLDERKKIVKLLREKATIKEFSKLKEDDLLNYAKNIFNDDGYKINYRALNLLISKINNNLELLSQEINKLMIYRMDKKEIDETDIEELVPKYFLDDIFSLVDAVVKRDMDNIFAIYDQLLVLNEEPIKIIAVLANQFRLIYQTKKMYSTGLTEKDIAAKLNIHPYRVKLANEVKLSENCLLKYLDELADLDIGIKTGKINKDIALEMFFLQL